MKTVNWESGIKISIGSHPPKDGKVLLPTDNVAPNMRVSAKYKDIDVYLKIIEEIKENSFRASILFFELDGKNSPNDLFEGDEVLISRNDICCLFY